MVFSSQPFSAFTGEPMAEDLEAGFFGMEFEKTR